MFRPTINLTPTVEDVDQAARECRVLVSDQCNDPEFGCLCLVLDDGATIASIKCPSCGTQWVWSAIGWSVA